MRHSTMRVITLTALMVLLVCALPATATAAQRTKRLNPDGSVPAQWDIKHAPIPSDDSTPASLGGDGTGSNNLSFSAFDDGDMVCAFPGGLLTGHAGIWKDSLYTNGLYSWCVWSANTTPVNGVQKEQPRKYQQYDYAYGEWVPTKSSYGLAVVNWCAAQAGEPYVLESAKTDYSRWYCSKLPWAGWKVKTGLDLDADGGYWVKPADLVNDSQTSTFAFAQ